MRTILLLVSVMLVSSGQTAHAAPAPGNSCVTARCHAGMLKKKVVHPAAEPCETCHQQVSAPHPKGAAAEGARNRKGKNRERVRDGETQRSFTLTEALPKLCYQCHAAFGTMKTVHPPVKEGQCTACHDPHDSAEPKLLARPASDLCSSCHPGKKDHEYVHPPTAAGECLSCHNPHESANARLLVRDGAELCLACHADPRGGPERKKTVHPALEAGCTSCHDPHGSSAKKFLVAEGAALCFSCHPAIESKVTASAGSVHPPVLSERGCASCHSPHATDGPKLLLKAGKDLCLDCHKDLIRKNDIVLHGPIRDGGCAACHDPHGTPNEKLLVQPYSSDLYVVYNDTEFPLCFSCHDREMLKSPATSSATGFRDGDQNLHYLHVNRKDRGKRCKACHAVHASKDPKLIATTVLFGKWSMPLNFVKTENGGSCAPGCHQPYAYDRKTPAKGKAPALDKDRKKRKKKK